MLLSSKIEMKFLLILLSVIQASSSENASDVFNLPKIDLKQELTKLGFKLMLDFSDCAVDLKKLHQGVKKGEFWALKMIDASSKIPSGVLQGVIADPGNIDECLSINEENNNIQGKYCTGKIPLSSEFIMQLTNTNTFGLPVEFRWAICVPRRCSAQTISSYMNEFLNKYNATINFNDDRCQVNDQYSITNIDIVAICIVCILISLVITATIYDIYLKRVEEDPKHRILVAFSCYTNSKELFHIPDENKSGHITCLSGIRFITMAWIVYAHGHFIATLFPVINSAEVVKYVQTTAAIFIYGATVTVDTFLLMSGMLISYISLKQFKNGIKFKDLFIIYLHRLIRILPAMAMLVLFYVSLVKFISSGPYWGKVVAGHTQSCEKYWWTTLLFIRNYYNPLTPCLKQSWYLDVDMQLYILAPFLMMFFKKFKKSTYPVLLSLAVLSSIAAAIAVYIHKMATIDISPAGNDNREQYLYVPTHTRAAPWCIGMALGYVLHHYRGKSITLSPTVVIAGWIISIGGMFAITDSLYFFIHKDSEFDAIADISYAGCSRICWAICISWVIFACEKGYGGIINSLLSFKLWLPLSKVTYSQYLVHPILQTAIRSVYRTPFYHNQFIMFYNFVAEEVITLAFAVILCLTCEWPLMKIGNIMLAKDKTNTEHHPERANSFGKSNMENFGHIDVLDITKM